MRVAGPWISQDAPLPQALDGDHLRRYIDTGLARALMLCWICEVQAVYVPQQCAVHSANDGRTAHEDKGRVGGWEGGATGRGG